MPITDALPGPLQWLGIAKEATPGTPLTPAYYMAPKTITPKDDVGMVDVEAMFGSMTAIRGEVQTIQTGSVEVDGDFYPDTDGFPLMGILSDLTESGASAPYTHTASLLNAAPGQPHTYTLTHSWGATEARQRAFGVWDSVDIKFTAAGLVTITASATTFASVQVTPTTPTISTVLPPPSWVGTVTLQGAQEYTIFDGNVQIKRVATPVKVLNGTQTPGSIFGGLVTVTGKLSVVSIASDVEQVRYLDNTQGPLVLNFTQGTGASELSLNLQMSQVAYKVFQLGVEQDYMKGDIDFTAIANTTDAGASGGESPIKATLINAIPAGIY
jgi:hypothetical protein